MAGHNTEIIVAINTEGQNDLLTHQPPFPVTEHRKHFLIDSHKVKPLSLWRKKNYNMMQCKGFWLSGGNKTLWENSLLCPACAPHMDMHSCDIWQLIGKFTHTESKIKQST